MRDFFNMTVKIAEFQTKKGRTIKYIEIAGEKYPTRIGIKKALKVIENQDEIKNLIDQLTKEPALV